MSRTDNISNVVFASEWQTIACKPDVVCSAFPTEDTTGVVDNTLVIAAQGILCMEDTIDVLDSSHDESCMEYIVEAKE